MESIPSETHWEAKKESSKESPDERSDLPEPNQSPRTLHGINWFLTITAILSTTLLFSLDTTIVANVQPSIIKDFGEVTKLSWLGTAFALGSASTILPWSKIYGILNIKWLYVAHVITFETGSALCGGAPNMNALIVGRAIAGLGASGMYVGCLTYISVLTTVQERPIYMGLIGLVWGLGTILGPVIGGAFIDSNATWRWAFYINLVVGGLFAPVYLFLLPSVALQPNVPRLRRLTYNIDWLGNLFFISCICCFTMAITFGGTLFGWSSAKEIVLWVMTGSLLIAFVLSQLFHPLVEVKQKLYPTTFLRRPVMVMLQVAIFMASVSLLIPVYYIPLFYQFTRGDSAISSAVHLLPFVIMVVIFSLANGSLMAKLGYYMPWYLFGGALVLTGAALMCQSSLSPLSRDRYIEEPSVDAYNVDTVTPTTSTAAVYGYTILIGAGAGSFLQAGFGVTQALLEPGEVTDAVGFMSFGQSIGIVTALAIAGSVFQNRAVAKVLGVLPVVDPSTLRSAITGTDNNYLDTVTADEKMAIIKGIVSALGDVYIVVIVAGAAVVLIGVGLPKNKLFTTT